VTILWSDVVFHSINLNCANFCRGPKTVPKVVDASHSVTAWVATLSAKAPMNYGGRTVMHLNQRSRLASAPFLLSILRVEDPRRHDAVESAHSRKLNVVDGGEIASVI
jgi:hypothetical protein